MGGVCSGGAKREIKKGREKTSASVVTVKNGVTTRQKENHYSTNKVDDVEKSKHRYNRGEEMISFSSELKPSTAAKHGHSIKVCLANCD